MPSLRSSFPRDCRPSCIVTFTPPSAFLFLLVINSLLSRVASAPLDHVSPSNQGTSTTLYAVRKTSNVRLAAVICASASTLSSFVAFYWFARMQKRFRHRYVRSCQTQYLRSYLTVSSKANHDTHIRRLGEVILSGPPHHCVHRWRHCHH